jgi:hypothetical protein
MLQQIKTPVMACASCHADPHLGQLGLTCERCHAFTAAKFAPVGFDHDAAEFKLSGKHRPLDCSRCHAKALKAYPSGSGYAVQFHPMAKDCRSCHVDQHLGQVDAKCETCHTTTAFAIANYKHRGFEQFFAGSHGKLACNACHKKETADFPAGAGTTVRYRVGTTCLACHKQF